MYIIIQYAWSNTNTSTPTHMCVSLCVSAWRSFVSVFACVCLSASSTSGRSVSQHQFCIGISFFVLFNSFDATFFPMILLPVY